MSNQDNNSESLEERVRGWLLDQGYPLEMQVAAAFHNVGAHTVLQSEFYEDPETGTQRELDVAAWFVGRKKSKRRIIDVGFAVECKSTTKPWVLFKSRTKRLHPHARVAQRAWSASAAQTVSSIAMDVADLPIFWMPRHPGHGVTCAFTRGHDDAYQAIQGAAKSAVSLAQRFDGRGGRLEEIHRVVFPVVVVNAPLFECSLTGEGDQIELKQITSSVLVWRNPLISAHTMLHLVTEPALPEFCQDAAKSAEGLITAIVDHLSGREA